MGSDTLRSVWPEWQIEDKPLGKGSFGVVYKAVRREHNLESYAAIKVVSIPSDSSVVDSLYSDGLDADASKSYLQEVVTDFIGEIQLMESLKGTQNIVSVEDYKVVERPDAIGWDIYIRMELLTPFPTYIRDRKMTEGEVIRLGCDICSALEICSQRNIIHRDIKPENIFVNSFGHFKLGDFGTARKLENMTGSLSQKGTFNYMAPEVANGGYYDARVDIYSLGIVLYRLLNRNRLPFLDSDQQLLNPNERKNAVDRRLRGENLYPPCDASAAMADIILRACAYDPIVRFPSATEMKHALMQVSNGTYSLTFDNLDRTVSVRRTPTDYDGTISVRRPVHEYLQNETHTVGHFGATSAPKRKILPIITAILAGILLLGAGIFAAIGLLADNRENADAEDSANTSEAAQYSKFDNEKIDEILSESEQLASEEDYEGALTKVQTGLAIYPKSEALQEKAEEYSQLLQLQIQDSVLASANAFAEYGDYQSAMETIRQAQDTYGNNDAYQQAYDTYLQASNAQTLPPTPQAPSTADMLSDTSILPLITKALQERANEDAKWDRVNEIPGESTYTGYVYMENPYDQYDNRIYLVFLTSGTVKGAPIEFVYWVYFDDIAFDSQGNISYATMKAARDDKYTVKTAFGSYYSYYGLDDFALFDYYIIGKNDTYEVVKDTVTEIPITHPVSDTFR